MGGWGRGRGTRTRPGERKAKQQRGSKKAGREMCTLKISRSRWVVVCFTHHDGGMMGLVWREVILAIFLLLLPLESAERVAICFFGLTRSLYYTKQSIHSHIFDILMQHGISYDVYVHTYNMHSIWNSRSREYNVSLNKNEWKLLYPHQHVLDDNEAIDRTIVEPMLPMLLRNGDPWKEEPPHHSLRNLVKQFYSLKRVTELWRNRTDYRLVIYSRPDMWFFNDLNITDVFTALHDTTTISNRFMYVPNFHSWGGLNDRFAFGPPKVMRIYGSRLDQTANYSKFHPLHPETFLKDLVHHYNITARTTDILFERVRSNGILWGVPHGEAIPDKAKARYQLVKNILGHWNAVPIEKKPSHLPETGEGYIRTGEQSHEKKQKSKDRKQKKKSKTKSRSPTKEQVISSHLKI